MKYRAKLIDPGNTNQERPVEIQTNSMEDVQIWAYGKEDGGMERPRGVLPGAFSPDAIVQVFAIEEKQIAILTKRGKPE
jgi:hypothetical protein